MKEFDAQSNPLIRRAVAEKRNERTDGLPVFNKFSEITKQYGNPLRVEISIAETKIKINVINAGGMGPAGIEPRGFKIQIESLPYFLIVNEKGDARIEIIDHGYHVGGPRFPTKLIFDKEMFDGYMNLATIITKQKENEIKTS
ncbi:MAG: hypothetical protein A3B47_01385 [Candidatus Levybacteria bacterium RIFCSPLOWO2_01_FULL_39_24]|nr:MAG: hypothetical protein A2800_03420 [Candidatus Levybacteria bacterium RIFCSPHIGHO2_01_FULL_40_16]OGH28640.1 MAG: hypothetical protein A3E12_03320 [Candidatus Levybacteria bacterium RIFCSPHIGHO2_12_FULL_39_9]OGH46029.1 MAG: hypothetical protein A3B47_01385 [Candidatus Levybacteria bacterium RIFCSPLOWO2_01_FULL_39_24]